MLSTSLHTGDRGEVPVVQGGAQVGVSGAAAAALHVAPAYAKRPTESPAAAEGWPGHCWLPATTLPRQEHACACAQLPEHVLALGRCSQACRSAVWVRVILLDGLMTRAGSARVPAFREVAVVGMALIFLLRAQNTCLAYSAVRVLISRDGQEFGPMGEASTVGLFRRGSRGVGQGAE